MAVLLQKQLDAAVEREKNANERANAAQQAQIDQMQAQLTEQQRMHEQRLSQQSQDHDTQTQHLLRFQTIQAVASTSNADVARVLSSLISQNSNALQQLVPAAGAAALPALMPPPPPEQVAPPADAHNGEGGGIGHGSLFCSGCGRPRDADAAAAFCATCGNKF